MQHWMVTVFLLAGVVASILSRKLTIMAALSGGTIGYFIYKGIGFPGIAMMTLFFLSATVATSVQQKKKEALGIMEEGKGKRKSSQVFANAGLAGLLGFASWMYPHYSGYFVILVAACFSSAIADTLSSEIGNAYGHRFFNIWNFKKDKRGLNGVVSIEGFLAGLAGSVAIALVYSLGFGWDINFLWIVLAGTAGNIFDSVLGATWERKGKISNDGVNFLNILFAAFICYALLLIR